MRKIIEGKIRQGQTVHVNAKDGTLEFREKSFAKTLGLDRKIGSNSR